MLFTRLVRVWVGILHLNPPNFANISHLMQGNGGLKPQKNFRGILGHAAENKNHPQK